MQIIVIPARIGSTRLPRKPLLEIHGKPTIQHVYEAAAQTGLPVLVATDSQEIQNTVQAFGGQSVMTDPGLRSGTDRVFAAIQQFDPYEQYTEIVNLQGDMPFVKPIHILDVLRPLQAYQMGTVVYPMQREEQLNRNSVKAIVTWNGLLGNCHWFTRAPVGYGYHHAGIYSFKRQTLARISDMLASQHETIEQLEQLRALENNIAIGCFLTEPVPMEINTPEDLQKANSI